MFSRIILLHLQEQAAQQGIRAVELGFATLDEAIELGARAARAQVNGFAWFLTQTREAAVGQPEPSAQPEQPIGVLYDGLEMASTRCHELLREYAQHTGMQREFMQDLLKCMLCMPVTTPAETEGESECEVAGAKTGEQRQRATARTARATKVAVTVPE